MDSIKKASSGHMGLPLGCAEIGAVLFGQEMYASHIQWTPLLVASQSWSRLLDLPPPLGAQAVQPGRPAVAEP